jgi:hypothetical protein
MYVLSGEAPSDIKIMFETEDDALFKWVIKNFTPGHYSIHDVNVRVPMFQYCLVERWMDRFSTVDELKVVWHMDEESDVSDYAWLLKSLNLIMNLQVKQGEYEAHCIQEPSKYTKIASVFGCVDY